MVSGTGNVKSAQVPRTLVPYSAALKFAVVVRATNQRLRSTPTTSNQRRSKPTSRKLVAGKKMGGGQEQHGFKENPYNEAAISDSLLGPHRVCARRPSLRLNKTRIR